MKQKNIHFSSKANVLLQLARHAELHIPPLYIIDMQAWQQNKIQELAQILLWAQEHARPLAVRSSCSQEDSTQSSAAGAFTSLLHIPHTNKDAIAAAIEEVFHSYGHMDAQEQVLLQPMVEHIAVSGVIMTRALDDGSPYYVINYDDESGKTDSITGGQSGTKTVYIYRDAQENHFDSQRLFSFVRLARRVEELCQRNDLDIEFCQSHEGKIHLLQVRPICSQQQWIAASKTHVQSHIDFIVDFVATRTKPWPELYGESTILGVMPDWNPAEIIGVTPRPLASSLYRELITRRVWSQARQHMGYRVMPPEELMILLAGRPYIDVRVSFNSFLPQGLDANISQRLVTAWLKYLDANPHLHDKIEFSVAQTTLDFCFHEHIKERYPHTLNTTQQEEFRLCLQKLTNTCLHMGKNSSVAWAQQAIATLHTRQQRRLLAPPQQWAQKKHALLPHIALLCEECKQLGTLPFAILARHAFIAETLLRTAVERGALSAQRLELFKKSLHTVASDIAQDFMQAWQGSLQKKDFMARYGHLRPSSYDILSPRYADREGLFSKSSLTLLETHKKFQFTPQEQAHITQLMHEAGLHADALGLEEYARTVIPAREWAKFVFTKNLSDSMELLAIWGESLELDRETLSFLTMPQIMEWASQALLQKPRPYFEQLAQEGCTLHTLSRSLKLGYIIRSPRDVYIVPQHRSAPNFIGHTKVEAPVLYVHAHSSCSEDISGCVVCIENADPGFDWIFTRNIQGLVTKFGGTNSHMAIRCAEYGLPAAIGVGEMLFERIRHSKHCVLHAGAHILQPL